MRIELTLNMKFMCHLYDLDSNEMARPEYYETALKKVYILIRHYRDIANRVASNDCRLMCILDTWFKKALEHSARVGLSEYAYQNAFPTNFTKQLSTKENG